jgi:hypothetical protein
VKDRQVHTRDLEIFGDAVDLSLDGRIAFDGSLDMVMDIRYSKAILDGASLTGGFVPLVVQQAENFISQHKVSGTLAKPKYEKMLLPSGRMVGKKLTGVVQSVAR